MSALSGPQNARPAPGPDDTDGPAIAAPGLLGLWLRPVAGPLAQVRRTVDTPLAELTMTDVLAWAAVVAYAAATGLVAGRLAGNLAVAALRPPRYR